MPYPSAKYPAAAIVNADLTGPVPDFGNLRLSGVHTAGTTTVTVKTAIPAFWPQPGILVIDSEEILYQTFSGSVFSTLSRGYNSDVGGGGPDAHSDNALVSYRHVSARQNQIHAELVAIEAALLNGIAHVLKPSTDNARDLGTAALQWRDIYLGRNIVFGAATAKVIPGATSLSFRNHADSADNILVTDAGAVTVRSALTVTAGGLTVTAGGVSVVAGQVLVPNGTAAAPPFAFGSDTGTGFYRVGASEIGLALGGTIKIDFLSALTTIVPPVSFGGALTLSAKVINYNSVNTAGWGVPAINGYNRATAQTAANASVATYTVGAADGSFIISANVLVTASATHSFSVECAYTDEGGTARVVTFNVQQIGGTLVTSITNVTGAGPYEGVPLHIRAKASTSITIRTNAAGTYTSVTYNVEGLIQQVA